MKDFFIRYRLVIIIAVGARVVLALFSLLASNIPSEDFAASWSHWDGFRYLNIAEDWYGRGHGREIVWYPLYPLAINMTTFLLKDAATAAVTLSILFSIIASILLFKLTRLDFDERTATLAVLFMNIFPTSFFLQAAYTESLFLTLTIGAFYWFRKEGFILSGVLGALATATRPNGIILIPALLVEAFSKKRSKEYWKKAIVALSAMGIGFGAYLGLNQLKFGNSFYYLAIYREYQNQELAFPWQGVASVVQRLNSDWAHYSKIELGAFIFGAAAALFAFKEIRKSYGVYTILNLLLATSVSYLISLPRYLLTLFPIFIALGGIKKRIIIFAICAASIPLLLGLTDRFVKSFWAF